jgi:hypothetical protein
MWMGVSYTSHKHRTEITVFKTHTYALPCYCFRSIPCPSPNYFLFVATTARVAPLVALVATASWEPFIVNCGDQASDDVVRRRVDRLAFLLGDTCFPACGREGSHRGRRTRSSVLTRLVRVNPSYYISYITPLYIFITIHIQPVCNRLYMYIHHTYT